MKANLKGVDVHEREIQHAIDSILLQIDNSLSGYNKGSLLSVFNSGREISPDTLFLDIYVRSLKRKHKRTAYS